jgi:putative nucleotidyltransferase with HDIG domain
MFSPGLSLMELDKQKQKQQIEKFIKKMPSLSTTVGKVLEICSRTDASPNELNKVISLDPILTGQLLKLINSAYYSLLNKITSLTRAITMLGMNTVKNMALSTAIIRSVSGSKKSKALPTSQYWQHSIGVGVSAKLLAAACGIPIAEREEMFVAGLLHDLGKVPFGDEYIDVLNTARKEQRPLIEIERELMGIDHQEVGMMIAEKWKLNTVINSCIGDHHQAREAVEGCRRQVALVALANMYVNIHDIGYAGDPFPDVSDIEELLEIAGLSWQDYSAIGEDVENEIEKAQIFLHV